MSGTIGKMAPTAIVVALAAWCCWPYLEAPGPVRGVQQDSERLRISGELLSPAVEPAPRRDPFRPLDVNEAVAAQSTAAVPAVANRKGAASGEGSAAVLGGLVLGATYIQGDRRVAIINGQVYEEGEPLAISASMTEPCTVTRISAEKVLILHRGRTVELKYPDLALKADPTKTIRGAP